LSVQYGGEVRTKWTDPGASQPSSLESPWQIVRVVLSRAACITPMLPAPTTLARKSLKPKHSAAQDASWARPQNQTVIQIAPQMWSINSQTPLHHPRRTGTIGKR
jgi:hypothetical protein